MNGEQQTTPRMSDELARLIEAARNHKMTPAEARAQRRSFIRGQTGATDEQIIRVLPELADEQS